MKRSALIAVLAAAAISGGWFVRRLPQPPPGALCDVSRAKSRVSVYNAPQPAAEAVELAAAGLLAGGWTEAPVSTATFRLLTRGSDVTALVAEDLPDGGSRVTTLHCGDSLL